MKRRRKHTLAVAFLLAGCACERPDTPNDRDAYAHHRDALVRAYVLEGYAAPDLDWGSLHITAVDGAAACGPHSACMESGWPRCPHIRVRRGDVDDVMHEMLHWLVLDAAGLETPGHDEDLPGFGRIVRSAVDIYQYEQARSGR